MDSRQSREQLLGKGEVVDAPIERACTNQTFELPVGIYVAMAALFAGFVGVLGSAFRGEMAVSYGVICVFIAAFFAVPAVFSDLGAGRSGSHPMRWSDFRERGIGTATGHSSAREATILVLLLPFLILCFAIAVVSVASFVE